MEERKKHEIHWVNREDANFPERLKKLTGMPKKLYYIGNLQSLRQQLWGQE